MSSTGTARSIARGLGALVLLGVLVVGVPWCLLHVAGSPLPASIPDPDQVWAALTSRDDGTLLLGMLKYVAWGGWLLFVASIVADLLARARGLQVPRLGPQQRFATQLVGAALALSVAVPGTAAATPAPAGPAAASVTVSTPLAVSATGPQGGADWRTSLAQAGSPARNPSPSAAPVSERSEAFTRYTVLRGDCLWDIAWNELGDPERWPELYDASRHLRQPGGQRITDPDHIEPGWTVLVPRVDRAIQRTPARADHRPVPSAHTPVITPLGLSRSTDPRESQVQTPLSLPRIAAPVGHVRGSVSPEPWEASVWALSAASAAGRGWRARLQATAGLDG